METTKAWYKSTTIQGDITVVLGLLIRVFDLPIITGEIEAVVSAVLTVVGIVMVFVGRLKAKTAIA